MPSADRALAGASAPPVELHDGRGTPIGPRLVGATAADRALRATFDAPPNALADLLASRRLHLSPTTAGPGAEVARPDGELRIEALLEPSLAPGVVALAGGDPGLALRGVERGSALLDEASWYATTITWAVDADGAGLDEVDPAADLRAGIRTAWGATRGERLPLAAHLAWHLDARGWRVDALDRRPGFTWRVSGSAAAWTTTAVVDEDDAWCALWSVADVHVGPAARQGALVALSERTTDLLFGGWELTRAGSVRFRTSIELPDPTAAGELLARLVDRHLDVVDEQLGALQDQLAEVGAEVAPGAG